MVSIAVLSWGSKLTSLNRLQYSGDNIVPMHRLIKRKKNLISASSAGGRAVLRGPREDAGGKGGAWTATNPFSSFKE